MYGPRDFTSSMKAYIRDRRAEELKGTPENTGSMHKTEPLKSQLSLAESTLFGSYVLTRNGSLRTLERVNLVTFTI